MKESELFSKTDYQFLGLLGKGGAGTVYLVEHRNTHRVCAAKVFHKSTMDRRTVKRLRVEAQSLAAMRHENIVKVIGDGVTLDGRTFFVMERLKGELLSTRLVRGPKLSVENALSVGEQILSALERAHSKNILHRDVKPGNVFVRQERDGVIVTVFDFGLAKVLPGAPEDAPDPLSVPTTAGSVLGSPRYMSPEGASGGVVSKSSDLYSAALVLHHMLSGQKPFAQLETPGELVNAQITTQLDPPSKLNSFVSSQIDRVVIKALAKNPSARFQSAEEFRTALRRAAKGRGEPFTWTPTSLAVACLAVFLASWVLLGLFRAF